MNKIPSFTINHNKLLRGIYVSRKDEVGGEVITTFDIRMKVPNQEPCLHNGAIHTIEHLAATYLRNDEEWKDRIIYWGPMGCLTGNYLLIKGDLESKDIVELMLRKNHDYDEAWRSMRVSSYTDFILTKIQRVKEIEDIAGATLVSEGIDANYMDIINYAVFGAIKMSEK